MSSGQSFGIPSDASSSSSYVHGAAAATILMSSGTGSLSSSYSSSPASSDPDKPVGYGAFGVVWCVVTQCLTSLFDLAFLSLASLLSET